MLKSRRFRAPTAPHRATNALGAMSVNGQALVASPEARFACFEFNYGIMASLFKNLIWMIVAAF